MSFSSRGSWKSGENFQVKQVFPVLLGDGGMLSSFFRSFITIFARDVLGKGG
jgi:hypothetical protein